MSSVSNNMRIFNKDSFKNTLSDNEELVIPGSKILVINGAPIAGCFAAEIAMANGRDLPTIVTNLFQSSVGLSGEKVKFGTLGILAGGVSPEDEKFGVVSSEPMHISLHNDIVFKVDLTDIFKKMILGALPSPVVIKPDQKLLLKDIRIYVEHEPDGSLTPETDREFKAAIARVFYNTARSLSTQEANIASNFGTRAAKYDVFSQRLKIERAAQGILVSSANGVEIHVNWVDARSHLGL